jgi:MYXO-CTERM domain-containing protein
MRARSLLSATLLASLATVCTGVAHANPPVRVSRGAFATPPAAPEVSARRLVDEATPGASALTFRARLVDFANGERTVRFAQQHKGLPVAHRGATVTFGKTGVARMIASHLETTLPDDVEPTLTAAQAANVVTSRARVPVTPERAQLAIWPSPEGNVLAWVVYPLPLVGIPYAPVYVLDAQTGETVVRYNALVELNQAQLYPTNPVKSPGLIDVTLSPEGATLENALIKSLNCIDQKSLVSVFGFNVHTCDLLQTAFPDTNGDYLVAPGGDTDPEDAFSEITMFYHANRVYEMFRGYQPGFTVQASALSTVSNLRLPQGYDTFDTTKMGDPELPLVPFQNAFYSPGDPLFAQVFDINGGALWFGQGPAKDYSYDGDVVYHELSHAVVDATIKLVGTPHLDEYGVSYSPGGMNEGLADYFSSALTGDPDVGEYASKDIDASLTAIRSLDNGDACPTAIGGEVHQDATLFSGALWETRTSLSAEEAVKLDAAVFSAMNAAPSGDLSYEELAELIAGEVDSALGTPIGDSLRGAWSVRGVLPKCTRILEWQGTQLDGPEDLYSLWWAPGMNTTSVKNLGWTPGVVQFHAVLPEGTARVTAQVSKSTLIQGGSGFGQPGTPFAPKLLVRFGDKPIEFSYQPFAATDDLLVLDPEVQGSKHSVTLDVPAGTTSVYVMVGSAGEDDGGYNHFLLSTEAGTEPPPDTTATTTSSSSSGGGSSASPTSTTEVDGCGCEVPGSAGGAGDTRALAVIALAGVALRRAARRRKV